jgi:hypothetical protein
MNNKTKHPPVLQFKVLQAKVQAVSKKKRKGMLVTFPNQKKEIKLHEKD